MDIKKTQLDIESSKQLLDLLHRKYGKYKNFDYFLADYQKALDFCIDNENISTVTLNFYKEDVLEGHTTLIFDKRLPQGEALFGFFEMPEDIAVFKAIWENIVQEAKEREVFVLKGPINGSIWHQYRCIKETDGSDFFKSELFTEKYYYDLLKSNAPTLEITYHSGYRERFDAILKAGQTAYDKLGSLGFSVKEMEAGFSDKLQRVAEISRIVFKNSWGYVELNQKEFIKLYSADKLTSSASKIYLLYHKENIIGFCGIFMEDSGTLICKTIAVLPEYQGAGLGNALAFKVHLDAQEQGLKKIIYALVREDNNIKNFPKEDAVIFRRYAAFEFKI